MTNRRSQKVLKKDKSINFRYKQEVKKVDLTFQSNFDDNEKNPVPIYLTNEAPKTTKRDCGMSDILFIYKAYLFLQLSFLKSKIGVMALESQIDNPPLNPSKPTKLPSNTRYLDDSKTQKEPPVNLSLSPYKINYDKILKSYLAKKGLNTNIPIIYSQEKRPDQYFSRKKEGSKGLGIRVPKDTNNDNSKDFR